MPFLCEPVFPYAVAAGRGETDPTATLLAALALPRTTHHPPLLEPSELLRSIDAYSGHTVTTPHS